MFDGGGNILGNDSRPAIDASNRDVKLGGFTHKLSGLHTSPERNLLDLIKIGRFRLFFRSLGNNRRGQGKDSQ